MPIQEMTVHDCGFLIEKLASDCAPSQFVRELTTNALQAIEDRRNNDDTWEAAGQVIWDVDWNLVSEDGLYKLQVSDNGIGMTGPAIEQNINLLSSSGRVQAIDKNFGVGAKITAAVSNPEGCIYKSWVNGAGVHATLIKDSNGNYGLSQFQTDDGKFANFDQMDDKYKPQPIDSSGTSVTLMGQNEAENTFMPPSGKNKWLIKYLNDRYFEFPSNTTVKVRNFRRTDPNFWPTGENTPMTEEDGSQLREIRGMKYQLSKHSEKSGVLVLSDANAHWWLLPEEEIKQKDIWESTAHCAALFQGELYDFKRTHAARSRLRDFGIVFGTRRVIIYIEPDTRLQQIYANTSRSALLIDKQELPWEKWQTEFRNQMPPALKQMMDNIASKAGGKDNRELLLKRLKEMAGLMKVQRYIKNPKGTDDIDGAHPGGEPGTLEDPPTPTPPRPPRPRPNDDPGKRGQKYGKFSKKSGDTGRPISPRTTLPETKWISVEDGTRDAGDLEDRCARFIREDNLILINADFRCYLDLVKYIAKDYNAAGDSNIEVEIVNIARAEIETQLTEAVVMILSLEGVSPDWASDMVQKATNPEALTATIMPRFHMVSSIRRQLSARLGKQPGVVKAQT